MSKKILFSLLIILVSLIFSGTLFLSKQKYETEVQEEVKEKQVNIRPFSSFDHILGNPNAEILIIEYSDFGCVFCKEFHTTMNRILEDYGKTGHVAWVYRHFPIEELESNSRVASVASECVAEILGESFFWDFSSKVFSGAPNSLSKENLKKIAMSLGAPAEEYDECLKSEKIQKKVENDMADGLLIYEKDPNFGTPYSIIVSKNGYQTQIVGSQPYSVIKEIIENF